MNAPLALMLALIATTAACAGRPTRMDYALPEVREWPEEIRVDATAPHWPMHRGDAPRTGRAKVSRRATLELAWSFPTGGPVVSSPAIGVDLSLIHI